MELIDSDVEVDVEVSVLRDSGQDSDQLNADMSHMTFRVKIFKLRLDAPYPFKSLSFIFISSIVCPPSFITAISCSVVLSESLNQIRPA